MGGGYDDDFALLVELAMRHVLSALVQNVPGVLSHISGMLASRGYNIDSLAVGETEDPQLSRMTFVVVGDDSILEQVRKQLEKIVTVVRVDDVSSQNHVERDLMLLKVAAPQGRRSEIRELTDRRRGPGDGDNRDRRPGEEGPGLHRDDAAVRDHRVGSDRTHRHGPRQRGPGIAARRKEGQSNTKCATACRQAVLSSRA
jgi:acetolactate synthase small subunit